MREWQQYYRAMHENHLIQYSMTVYPTPIQFKNFHKYVEYLERIYSPKYGIVKIVPPEGWKAREDDQEDIEALPIPGPIEQNAYGRGGAYECAHISQKAMTVGDFKKKTSCFENVTDGLMQQEIETLFWKNVSFSSPLYAADIHLNLMDENSGAWNLNNLNSVLTAGMKSKLPGVNSSYCYFGSWKSFFCWHTEDMELSAINFLHSGKPKFWYGVAIQDRKLLEEEAKVLFPNRFQQCSEHMRHKTTLINPYKLKTKYPDLMINKLVQYPGEFIIAFSGAYHSGFNSGFNVAEAVNYATFKWLKDVQVAKYCKCLSDTVRISEADLARELIKSPFKKEPLVIEFCQSYSHILPKLLQIQNKASPTKSRQSKQSKQSKPSPAKKPATLKKKIFKKMLSDERTKAKRHKSMKKNKVVINGEQMEVENWAQCEKCKKWRKISFQLKRREHFDCKRMGSNCLRKEESSEQCITLK